jgi:hypothetical protein
MAWKQPVASFSIPLASLVFKLELGLEQAARIVGHAPQPGLGRLSALALGRGFGAGLGLAGLGRILALPLLLHRLLHALALGRVCGLLFLLLLGC